jgi:Lrp/AsnC family transcriptional regulator
MARKLDRVDVRILDSLQRDASLSSRELAEEVGLSQNACWRRVQALTEAGVLRGKTQRIDRKAVGLDLVVFTMVRTRRHSAEWLETFRRHVVSIPEVVDFHRIGGDYDYLLKIVTRDMAGFDRVYQRLISSVELDGVTSYFAMEAIVEQRPLHMPPPERRA